MLLKLYDANGVPQPLFDIRDVRILHKEDGCDRLVFRIDIQNSLYHTIAEESRIDYASNHWLVKKIQDDQIECEIDFDFLKTTVIHDYTYQNQLLGRVLAQNLPAGWTIVGADDCVLHRGKHYDHCTPYEVVYDCIGKYDVRFVWNTIDKVLTVRVPSRIVPSGVYLSDQLNLKSLAFQGSSVNFVTRLYPYGKDGLNIASINGGKEYIEDRTYSDKTVCAYWVDERYENQLNLLEAAYEKLGEMAKPERSYECSVRDLEKESSKYSHLALRMHDKITLMVSERKLRVVYSIVEYTEYPEEPELNKVTMSCVPDTIQSYTEQLVKANVDHAIVVAEKALEEAGKATEEIATIEETISEVEETVEEVSDKADDAFNRAESAMLEAEMAEMNVKDVIKGLAVPSDAFFCGDKSPTYGFSHEDAAEALENGIIYIPTASHAENYTEEEEFGIIDSKSPADRGSEQGWRTYDAGVPSDSRTSAVEVYASTPSQRVQMFGADFYFYLGKAYVWQNEGWTILSDVEVGATEPEEKFDGQLWLCTSTHSSDGVEYEKDTVYRWSAKEDSEAGLWIAKANKADTYSYKAISTVRDAVVALTAEVTEQASEINAIATWRTIATQAIADLEITASSHEASITTLLTFMGDSDSGAIKAIADLEATTTAQGSVIATLVAWMGDTDSGAIKAIADVTAQANANEASIEVINTWIGNSSSGATKAIADVTAKADANEANITELTTWKNSAAESIAELVLVTNSHTGQITALVERVGTDETNIATVTAKAENNAASIVSLTSTVNEHSAAVASLTQTTTEQGSEIASLTTWQTEANQSIAEIRQTSTENGAAITAIVTNDEKALALSGRKYVVGAKAPTYGYTYELACGIMETGTLYVPSATHTETYQGAFTGTIYDAKKPSDSRAEATILEAGFSNRGSATQIDCSSPVARAQQGGSDIQYELGWCYRWTGSGWAKHKTVSLYVDKTEGEDDELWYCTVDIEETDEETGFTRKLYTAGTLYCWIGDKWVALADVCNNYTQMAASKIEVQVGSISARVTDTEGDIAALQLRLTEDEATVTILSQWKSSVQSDVANISTIETTANAAAAGLLLKADKTAAISRADVYYALHTSATQAPTTGWSTTAPAWEDGKYMWQKTVCTYGNGSTTESAATCLTGAKGEDGTSVTILGSYNTVAELRAAHPTGSDGDSYIVAGDLYVWSSTANDWQDAGQIQGPAGAAGVGISSIKEQYYLSTSNTTQTGGTWEDTCPVWSSGKYIWTRSYIVWTDGTNSTTTPTLAQALNSFGASIAVNTASIALKVDAGSVISTINQSAEAVTISASKINLAGLITAINAEGQTSTIDGDKITSGTITAAQIDATNLHVYAANIDGNITANSLTVRNNINYVLLQAGDNTVSIGGFTVARNSSRSYIYSGKAQLSSADQQGVYIGTNGIAVGGASDGSGGYYNITLNGSTGKLTANNVDIAGKITATSGTIENLHITGKIYFGTGSTYYISADGSSDYYVKLKNFTVNDTNATFSGNLSAPTGNIGGFTIASAKLYKNQTTYDGSAEGDTAGVYLGTNGIGLGKGKFYVTSAGAMTAMQATVTGAIYANAGTLEALTITGRLFFGNNSLYYIDANNNDSSYYINLPGFKVDDANGAVFSGKLSAPSGTIGGFTIASGKLYKTKTAYNDNNSGVYLGTDGIGLGAGNFYVTSAGSLFSKSGTIGGFTITTNAIYNGKTSYNSNTDGVYLGTSGIGLGSGTFYVTNEGKLHAADIEAVGGKIQDLHITGKLYFGTGTTYYIDQNLNNATWYIYLKNFKVDDTNAYFSGNLQSPTGTIGGWSLGTPSGGSNSCIYKSTGSYIVGMQSGSTDADLAFFIKSGTTFSSGNDIFYVKNNGELYASNATVKGTFSNKSTTGYGIEITGSQISFYNGSSRIGYFQASTGITPWSHQSGQVNGIACSALLAANGGIRVGNGGLQMSTGNGVYISNKLALTMGQIKVQTNTGKTRYLLFYNGILVGINENKYSGYYDYSASTYDGDPV